MNDNTVSNLNFWLTDESFLNKSGYEGEELEKFKQYCHQIYLYLKNIAFPMIIFWNKKKKFFYCKIGLNYCKIPMDFDISLYDFQKLIFYWAKNYYPGYEIEIPIERNLSIEEMADQALHSEGDIFNKTKIDYIKEIFIIEKVVVRDDQIIVSVNDIKQIRITKQPVLLNFLPQLRKIKDHNERKLFIDENTRVINEMYVEKNIDIRYEGEQLLNFFRIWCPVLYGFDIQRKEDLVYGWDKFNIYFSNDDQVKKCLCIIEKFKNEYRSIKNIKNYLYKTFNIKYGVEEENKK